MKIRDATPEDAEAACAVLRASIIELCVADHGNDPARLERWLTNKQPEIVSGWIGCPDNSLLLAVDAGSILAVGSVTDAGEITLNYVAPKARFRGVSRALLEALEARAFERGNTCCRLYSTGNRAPFLLVQWLCRYRSVDSKIRHERRLPDVEIYRAAIKLEGKQRQRAPRPPPMPKPAWRAYWPDACA